MSSPSIKGTTRPLGLALALAALAAGCGGEVIPNTDVPDTTENREVIAFVEQYRHAVERRDVGALLRLVSTQYLDTNGTMTSADDRDYDRLREELTRWETQLLDVRYEMRYRRVTTRPDRILVDFTYTGSFKVASAGTERWTRRLGENRIALIREDGELRIISGL